MVKRLLPRVAAAAKESAGMGACARQLRLTPQHQTHRQVGGSRTSRSLAGRPGTRWPNRQDDAPRTNAPPLATPPVLRDVAYLPEQPSRGIVPGVAKACRERNARCLTADGWRAGWETHAGETALEVPMA
jgi:hypothetical protein